MSTTFQRRIENFTCEHCGEHVTGDGYTNHCPVCLWSKHVDKHPGDRLEECGGLMEPKDIEGSTDAYVIVHVCTKCGAQRRNKARTDDNQDVMYAIRKRVSS